MTASRRRCEAPVAPQSDDRWRSSRLRSATAPPTSTRVKVRATASSSTLSRDVVPVPAAARLGETVEALPVVPVVAGAAADGAGTELEAAIGGNVGIGGMVGSDSAETPVAPAVPDMPVGSENDGWGSGTIGIDGCTTAWGFAGAAAGGSTDAGVADAVVAGALVGDADGDGDGDDADDDVVAGLAEEDAGVVLLVPEQCELGELPQLPPPTPKSWKMMGSLFVAGYEPELGHTTELPSG